MQYSLHLNRFLKILSNNQPQFTFEPRKSDCVILWSACQGLSTIISFLPRLTLECNEI